MEISVCDNETGAHASVYFCDDDQMGLGMTGSTCQEELYLELKGKDERAGATMRECELKLYREEAVDLIEILQKGIEILDDYKRIQRETGHNT